MDIPVTQLPPGDPRLVEAIVGQLKSRGIFDQFRKECLADVDLKPAYQNLRQRVEGQVNKFLEKQIWKNDLNKNQLRESVRKHVHDAGMLGPGIDAIISQVVNPKINSLILPLVEDTVYAFLQIDKPKRESKVMSEPEKDIMNYHIRDQNGQHHHHPPPVMLKPPAPPPARAPLIPMDTDAISSEEDEILAHESPESGKRTSDDEKMELQMMDDNARDGFEDKSKITGDGGLYGPDSVVESVEKLKIKEEPSRGTKDESTSQEQVKPAMILFDNQSLDSISSNSSGLTFSPLSGRGSIKDEKIDDEGESSPPPSSEVRGEKQETGQNSNRSTPLIDEVKVEEGGSGHDIGSQLSQDLRSSRVGDPLEDVERSSSKETHPPVPSPSRLPSLPPELSKEGNRKTISGASPISLDEDSEMSKCSQGTNSSRGEKSEGELSSKSEGEISSKSLKSEGEASGKSDEPKVDKADKVPSIKSEKSEGEITSSSDSESRDTRDSYKPKRSDERHGSREDRHRSDGHRHKHDSRSSKERERDREKEKKREKSKDDHHSYKDKDRKHDRRDRDRDRDRSRGHHHSSSSSRKESSSSSSDRRDKERSSHYSSDRSTKEGKSRSSGSSEKQEKRKVENKGDQGKNDLKVEEKKREVKVEKSNDKSEIKKEAKADIKKSESKTLDKKSESKKEDIKQEDRQDRDSKDKSVKSKSESKDKKESINIKSSKHSDKDKKDKKDKDKKNDDKTSSKGKTGDRKPIEKKQIIVSLGKDRPLDKEPKNSFSKDIKKSKIASNNNEAKMLNKARKVGSTKNNLDCGVDFTSYGIDSEPMVLVSNDGDLLFVNYSDEKKKKHSKEAKSSSSDSDGCCTPPLVDSPKSKSKPFISKREASTSAKSVPHKKKKEMNIGKGGSATTLKSVTKNTKKSDAKMIASPTKVKSLSSKKKFKENINFEGFEAFERNTRLRNFLDSIVIIPDPLEEEDMQPDDYFLVVSETQLPENFSVDDFVKQVEWMGVRVNQTTERDGTHTETSKGEESEVPSDRSRARNRKRQASMSSTASNSSTSSTSGSSPKAKRIRRNVGQGNENQEEEVVCLEDDRTNTDVLVAGYALPTPEDDGHRTSTREYEVDYSRRESSYSPLSPSSDSSEDTKAKATAGTSVCSAPTMPELWKSGNSKHHPHHKQASLLISLNNGKVSVAKVGQQSSSISKRGQDCKTAQLYKLPFSKPGSQPS